MKTLKLIVGSSHGTEVCMVFDDGTFLNVCWGDRSMALPSISPHPRFLTHEHWLKRMGWKWVIDV